MIDHSEIEVLEEALEVARAAHEADPKDGEKHGTFARTMHELAVTNRAWRRQEEGAGRRVPGVIAEVSN